MAFLFYRLSKKCYDSPPAAVRIHSWWCFIISRWKKELCWKYFNAIYSKYTSPHFKSIYLSQSVIHHKIEKNNLLLRYLSFNFRLLVTFFCLLCLIPCPFISMFLKNTIPCIYSYHVFPFNQNLVLTAKSHSTVLLLWWFAADMKKFF